MDTRQAISNRLVGRRDPQQVLDEARARLLGVGVGGEGRGEGEGWGDAEGEVREGVQRPWASVWAWVWVWVWAWARDGPADLGVSRRRCRDRAAAPVCMHNAVHMCMCAHVHVRMCMYLRCTCTVTIRLDDCSSCLTHVLTTYQAGSRQQLLARRRVLGTVRVHPTNFGVVRRDAAAPGEHRVDECAGACSWWPAAREQYASSTRASL